MVMVMRKERQREKGERKREEIFQGISNHSQNGLWLVCHGLAIGVYRGIACLCDTRILRLRGDYRHHLVSHQLF